MNKSIAILGLISAASLALVGCSDSGTVEKGGASTASSTAAATTQDAEPASEAEDSKELQFGDKYTWENGLSLSISKPEAFKPSSYAIKGDTGKHVIMTVVIENGTGEDYDPVLSSFTASSSGEESEGVFDDANKLNGSPDTTVKAGKSIKFKIGFSVADPKDITLDASPGFEYQSKTFQN